MLRVGFPSSPCPASWEVRLPEMIRERESRVDGEEALGEDYRLFLCMQTIENMVVQA